MGSNETASTSTPLTGQQRTDIYDAASKALGGNSAINGQVSALSQYNSPTYTAAKDAQTARYQGAGPVQSASFTGAEPAQQTQFQDAGPAQQISYQDAGPVQQAQFKDAGQTRGGFYVDSGPAQTLNGGDYQKLQDSLINSRLAVLDRQHGQDQKSLDEQMSARGIYNSGLALRAQNDLAERYAPQEQAAISDAVNQRYNLQSSELNNLNNYGMQRSQNATQYTLANAGMLNEGDLSRANSANQFNMQNTSMSNEGNLARANAANQFNSADAARLDQYGQNQANAANQFNSTNAARLDSYNQNNASAANAFGLSNAAMLNQTATDRTNQANTFNLQNYAAQQQANQAGATAANTWAADQAQKQYDAKWRPMDYLQGLWNGTGGSVSSSTGGGWSI
jgi:hypothetical protein